MKMVVLIGCAAVILFLPSGGMEPTPAPAPEPVDCLAKSYTADRAARVAMLRTMHATEFSSDAKQAEWHREQSRNILAESFRPYLDAVAESIVSDQVEQLADELSE